MKKTLLTGITVASVAVSAGVAFAGVSAMHHASAESAPATSATAAEAMTHTTTYQIGVAGLVTLTTDGTTLTVDSANPGVGWTLVGTSAAGAHVEIQFTDGQQLVTFSADAVGDQIAVAVTNVPAGSDPTATTAEMPVTVVTHEGSNDGSTTPSAPTISIAPPSSHTVGGGSDDDQEQHDGEHEDEGDDD